MKKALIVDDILMNRALLIDMLCDEYEIIEASDGLEAVNQIEENYDGISVILLDLVMPNLDGIGVLEIMRNRGWIDRFPVLVITGDTEANTEFKCLSYGIADFIGKPFNETLVRKRVSNAEQLYSYKKSLEAEVEAQTAEIKEKNEKLEGLNDSIIQLLGEVVEARSEESGVHVKRVKEFTRIIAEDVERRFPEFRLTDEDVKLIVTASPMHDIGKIKIPDAILNKPGKLTEEEFAEMKRHTIYGHEVLDKVKDFWPDEYNRVCNEICLCHHERVDGKGYPYNLKDDEIPISAQIVSLADVYDALVTERVYKKPFTPEVAFEMISTGKCGQFSDKLMETFKHVRKKMEAVIA